MPEPSPLKAFEPFTCAPGLKLEAHERLSALHVEALNARLEREGRGPFLAALRRWLETPERG